MLWTTSIYTLKKAVTAGIGVAIVPSNAVNEEVTAGVLSRIAIRDIELSRPVSIVKLKKNALSRPAEVFLEKLLAFNILK